MSPQTAPSRLNRLERLRAHKKYSFAQRQKLLERALAPWPRRSAPLLVVNCGDGSFLRQLWHAGFEVAASEPNSALRGKAWSDAKTPGLELFAAADDDLPFGDDEFDWVILHCRRDTSPPSFAEASRVARRGMMVTFWNSASLASLLARWRKTEWRRDAKSWWYVRKHLRALDAGAVGHLSTLGAPECAWREEKRFLNVFFDWTPFGAWCVARVDFTPLYPVSPPPLRVGKTPTRPQPVFEYSRRNFVTQPTNKNRHAKVS